MTPPRRLCSGCCRTLALLAILLSVAAMGTAQTPATADPANPLHTASRQELDVVKVLLAQEDAWNRGDLDAFAASYKNSPDTLFVTNQINHGFAGLLEEYRKEYPSKAAMGTLSFAEIEVHTLDDRFAVCVGRYALERAKKFGGDAQGLFSLVLEKTSTGWKIVLDHST